MTSLLKPQTSPFPCSSLPSTITPFNHNLKKHTKVLNINNFCTIKYPFNYNLNKHTKVLNIQENCTIKCPLNQKLKKILNSTKLGYPLSYNNEKVRKIVNGGSKICCIGGANGYVVGGEQKNEKNVNLNEKNGKNGEKEGKGGGKKGKGEKKVEKGDIEALLRGGDQVTSVLEEMTKLLEDMNMNEASEEVAVQLAAHGVIGKRVDEMESGFMMALDYMIQLAEKDQDEKRKSLLEVIKETVLSHLTKKCPPHVQVVGLLCRTPEKESRQELLRRVAAGGGVFQAQNGTKVHLPAANLNDIANQADDILETMETRPVIPDRKLLARLVLIREEARNMMGGGILDERNDRGFNTLPEAEVNFLTKLVALKPGKTVQEMIKNVMQGKDEGAEDPSGEDENTNTVSGGIAGRASVSGRKAFPVRPGMFLETVSKVLGGIYAGNVSGITAQHLEWVHTKTLQVLQEIAF